MKTIITLPKGLFILFLCGSITALGKYWQGKEDARVEEAKNTESKELLYSEDRKKEGLEEIEKIEAFIESLKDSIYILEGKKPITPRVFDAATGFSFLIDFEPEKFPDLAAYEGVQFSPDHKRSSIPNETFDVLWTSFKLERCRGIDDYKLYVGNTKEKTSFYVFPVFKGKAYGKAMKVFEKKMAIYTKEFNRLQRKKELLEEDCIQLRIKWKEALAEIETLVEKEGREY